MNLHTHWKSNVLTTLIILLLAGSTAPLSAQVGEVIWEEQFNDLDDWVIEEGNGEWGWGNGELQYYQADNVDIVEVPGDPGNNALRITAREESGPDIVDQWGNSLDYTSGRLKTESKVAIQYGMIEARVRVPDLDLGGWPAVWLLGTANESWPRNGELDMMEMGHGKSFRDTFDDYNGGDGSNSSTVNQVAGANAIFYSPSAETPDNPTGAASIANDPNYNRPYFNMDNPLNGRFVTYRMYWDDQSIRFTVVDEGEEHDLYTDPLPLDQETSEFRDTFFMIINLAIGGNFTDAYNLGNPDSGQPVTMDFPAHMYVDYIKVHKWNGKGQVHFGPVEEEPETLKFPVRFEENLAWGDYITDFDGGQSEVVENPDQSGINESENVLKLVKGAGQPWAGSFLQMPEAIEISDDFSMTLDVWAPRAGSNMLLKIENKDDQETYVELEKEIPESESWSEVTFDLSNAGLQTGYHKVVMIFDIGTEGDGTSDYTWYVDNIQTSTTTDIESRSSQIPDQLRLSQNYPNPFNPSTKIDFALPEANRTSLHVYNAMGQRVATLVNETLSAGQHSARFDATGLSSGIYFYRLQSGSLSITKQMTLLK